MEQASGCLLGRGMRGAGATIVLPGWTIMGRKDEGRLAAVEQVQ